LAYTNGGGEQAVLFFDDIEDYPLALSECPENRPTQRTGLEVDLGLIIVSDDDPGTSNGIVCFHDSLGHRRLGLFDLAGANAGGADPGSTCVRTVLDANSLDIGQPATVVAFVREADGLAVAWLLAADFTAIRHV